MSRYAIGLDFGTLSARAVLLDAADGKIKTQAVYVYPHGVLDRALPDGTPLPPGYALQVPSDYTEAMQETIHAVMHTDGVKPEDIIGIGIDFTSATVMCADSSKTPLCAYPEFASEPHAYVKLWKHHGAEKEAAQIDKAAKETNAAWLSSHGGKVSSEWVLPKVLETLHCAPEVYSKAQYFMEAMDWLVWILTGNACASLCGAGYKMPYHDGGFPDESFFAAVDPRLQSFMTDKYPKTLLPAGTSAGGLCEEAAAWLGLLPGTPVASPLIDAHSSVPGCGICTPGELMIIMGTSSCHMLLSESNAEIRGIQGIVKDGILPGYYGIEAGQPCVGDLFAWAASACMNETYIKEAEQRGISHHDLLTGKLAGYRAGASGLLALDWFNGVRTPLMDFDLNGMIIGLTPLSRPEDIYLALLEATAYGTRTIIDEFRQSKVTVNKVILSGGIPARNKLIPQIYADVLHLPVYVSDNPQACATGAAFLGIAAASPEVSGFSSLNEIAEKLGSKPKSVYMPQAEQSEAYDQLYAAYRELMQYFGEGGSNIMHRLTALRRQRQ